MSVTLRGRCRLSDKLSVLSDPRHARRICSYYFDAETSSVSSVFIARGCLRSNVKNRHPFNHLSEQLFIVAIGNPERRVRNVSHRGSKQQQRSHDTIAYSRHIYTVVFFTHIAFVVNHTFNATPQERLQHYERRRIRQHGQDMGTVTEWRLPLSCVSTYGVSVPEVATESTRAGFCALSSGPDSKICENRIRSHLSFSAAAGVCVVFMNVIAYLQTTLTFSCVDGCRTGVGFSYFRKNFGSGFE